LCSDYISHAYLVNTNGCPYAFDFVMSMVKSLICPKHLTDNSSCVGCSLCRRIDEGNFPEIKIIDSDGMWIKKNQVIDLQEEFSKEALEGKKRVYVIRNADRMNLQTSNSILKFLEEPNNNIIAILMTGNINKILNTIVSRCQVINLQNGFTKMDTALENFSYICCDSSLDYDKFISLEDNRNFITNFLDFIDYFENNGNDVIVYANRYWHSKFKDRLEVMKVFDLIINFYFDVLNFKAFKEINFFRDYQNYIERVASKNEFSQIEDKLSVCIEFKEKLNFNVNLNLFFDKFIIELGGKDGKYSWC
jgi:DNA polymerase-3 subunit delta'